MKIKSNEKILVVFVLSLLVGVSYYQFYYTKQKLKIEELNEEKVQYALKVDKLKATIKNIPKKESDIKILNAKIKDTTVKFYPKIIQEKLILEIDKLMTSSNIIGTISFSDIVSGQDSKKDEEGKESNSDDMGMVASEINAAVKDKKNQGAKGLESMKLTIGFKGKYTDVLKFIKSVDEYSKKIAFTNISLSQTAVNEVSGSMALSFYAVPKIDDEDAEYFKWDLNNPYGKLNMFDTTQTVVSGESIEKAVTKEKAYDFLMSLKPIQSDLPTVVLGKAKDNERKSYVYADNSKEEKVEIYISEEDGRYYFKYKTSRGSYPISYEGKGEEFIPVDGSISLKVYSNKRLSENDEASADIQVYNKTNKTLNIIVEGDDSSKPRAKITANAGSIEVKKN